MSESRRRRSYHGASGLKCRAPAIATINCRTLRARGLKIPTPRQDHHEASHPSRGAWIENRYVDLRNGRAAGRTPHGGAWIEISLAFGRCVGVGRTPHGVRGLKYGPAAYRRDSGQSHPSRGAWIENAPVTWTVDGAPGRTPHGVRGLKYMGIRQQTFNDLSHPSRGAWIEMTRRARGASRTTVAPLTGCIGLKITIPMRQERSRNSHPSRGTWIEIECIGGCWWAGWFAPLTGCVD